MLSSREILDSFRIAVRAERHGNQKTTCPNCSHLRRHRRDPCLSVLIDNDGVFFNCKNCGWKGGKSYEAQSKSGNMVRNSGDLPGSRRTYGDLQRQARSSWRREGS
jgi:hypothetical protein